MKLGRPLQVASSDAIVISAKDMPLRGFRQLIYHYARFVNGKHNQRVSE